MEEAQIGLPWDEADGTTIADTVAEMQEQETQVRLPSEGEPGFPFNETEEEAQEREEQEEEEEEEAPPNIDLAEVLGEHLIASQESWPKKGRIWASELGIALGPDFSGCALAFWHKCRDAPKKTKTPGELLMLQIGNLVHDYVAEQLSEAIKPHGWEVTAVEERVYLEVDGETVGSRLDVEIMHTESGYRKVIDLKTKRGAAFGFLNDAKEGDVLQVQGYIKGKDADAGSVLYVDREGQNFCREFDVERADERPDTAIRTLVAIRDDETPPDPVTLKLKRVFNKGDDSLYLNVPWQIGWCDLKKCACKAALPCTPPDRIIAKLKTVTPKATKKNPEPAPAYTKMYFPNEKDSEFAVIILGLLAEDYPDETFTVEA